MPIAAACRCCCPSGLMRVIETGAIACLTGRMMRFLLIAIALSVTVPAVAQTDVNARARELLAARHLEGAVVMQDVRRGTPIADATVGEKWEGGILPLSTTRLFLAAIALDRGVHVSVDVRNLIAHGSDADG